MGTETPREVMHFTGIKLKSVAPWTLLTLLAILPLLPLSNFVGHPHWDHIRWIPFQDFALSLNMLKDIAGNTFWFMMFGYLLHYQQHVDSRSLRTIALITAITGVISLSTEFFQVFCHNRIPSITDVICNVSGAGLGGYFADKHRASATMAPWPATWVSKMMVLKRIYRFPSLYRQGAPPD